MKNELNLAKVKKTLDKVFKDWKLDFTVTIEEDKKRVYCKNNLKIKSYDDDILGEIVIYQSGGLICSFTFDKLPTTENVLVIINNLNAHSSLFHAYITGNGFLRMEHLAWRINPDLVGDYIEHVLGELADDDLKPYLTPLCELSKA